MKKLFILILLQTLVLMLTSCSQEDKAPLHFQSFQLIEQGMTIDKHIYEATKTEQGVLLEYYINRRKPSGQEEEDKEVLYSIAGDESLYQKLCVLLGECRIKKWHGFKGSNPNMADGTLMHFHALLADGSVIEASGHNRFPKEYHDFYRRLYELLTVSGG